MSLRTKVLLPLLLFGLALIGYLYGYWMPQSLDNVRTEYRNSTERHLDSVVVGVTPLLLGRQLDTIYENLDALRDTNPDWIAIELSDTRGKSLYPLVLPDQTVLPPGAEVHTLEKRIDYLGMNLGKLVVRVDFAPRLSQIEKQHRQLALVMFIVIITFLFSAWSVLERLVLRPVNALSKAADELAQNKFEGPPLEKTGDDEVAHLVDRFSEMRGALKSYRTDLEKSEARFRQALDDLLEGCMIIGFDWTCLYMNDTAARHFLDRRENLIGHNLREIYPSVESTSVFPHYRSCMEERVPQRFEATFGLNGDNDSWHAFSVEPVPEGIFVLSLDITERKRAENELRRYKDHLEEIVQQRTSELMQARDEAQAANKAKSAFLANMSHELRTPLNAILGFSNMMRQQPDISSGQRESLDIINRSGEHLLTLINDVLEVAKIEAGRIQLEIAPFDLGSMVRDVVDMMHLRAEERGLQLLLDQSSDFPRYIKGDSARLRQILVNLVSNAIKFTEHGGVTLRLGMSPDTTQRLLIEVEDSGPGIAPEDQKKLFQPFVQLQESSMQKGTGLGLTITRQFVQLMGGSINLESTPGKGSIFRIEIPVELAGPDELPHPVSHAHGDIVGLAAGQPMRRILIAEDQYENQILLKRLMDHIGLETRIARNGEECVQMFQDWNPHLIWMDRRMPVLDGIEATQRIRHLPGGDKVRIVAVTASAFKEQQQEILDAGMDDFVRKPYRFEEIYDSLARQLGLRFTYATDDTPPDAGDSSLNPGMLSVLPEALRLELKAALENLDREHIARLIAEAGTISPTLAPALSRLADNFDYPAILRALAASQQQTPR